MSIVQQISEKLVTRIIKADITKGLSSCIDEISDSLKELLPAIIEAKIAAADAAILKHSEHRKNWQVVHKGVSRALETRLGTVNYSRRLYRHKQNGKYAYLTDQVLGIERYERVERELGAHLCTLATELSYQKSSKLGSDGRVSRQTVMNLTRKVQEKPIPVAQVVPDIDELHLQCDEDHVARQDGLRSSIIKLVTIHEPRRQIGKRSYLPNKFSLTSTPREANSDFWERVARCVYERYGSNENMKIFIHGDGAAWIRTGLGWLPNSRFVLDKFHVLKQARAVSGGNQSCFHNIWSAVENCQFKQLKELASAMVDMEQCVGKTAENFIAYVKSNMSGIRIWQEIGDASSSCAEGLVSHVLSERMSSRPRGWLDQGMEAVSRLRVHCLNGGRISGDDLLRKHKAKSVNKRLREAVSREISDFAPLPTGVFVAAERGTSLYRLFDSIKMGGMHF